MNDQELQKIARDLHIAATIPLENWKGFGYPSESYKDLVLKALTQVRDAQEEKLSLLVEIIHNATQALKLTELTRSLADKLEADLEKMGVE